MAWGAALLANRRHPPSKRLVSCAVDRTPCVLVQAYADYNDMMDLTERIIRTCAQVGRRAGLAIQVSSTGSLVACRCLQRRRAGHHGVGTPCGSQSCGLPARRPGSTQPPACALLPLHRQAVCGQLQLPYQGQVLDFEKPFARKTMHELVQEKTGVDFEQFGGDVEVGGSAGRVAGHT